MKKIYISRLANQLLMDYLAKEFPEYKTEIISNIENVDKRISTHPDLTTCKLGISLDSRVFHGNQQMLSDNYPKEARFNGCCTEDYFLHKLSITDQDLLNEVKLQGKILINIPQGYGRCTCLPMGKNSLITSDLGIFKQCIKHGFINAYTSKFMNLSEEYKLDKASVLLISNKGILLDGYDYGFIGGSAGQIENKVVFNGNLADHVDFQLIRNYIESLGLKPIWFEEYPLTDIGSIIATME